ncbi:hypothetical protein KY284_001044 [Solanum tuberosum]|nr:hypothetical protein KY284_001044 [Solanum tuberosum]
MEPTFSFSTAKPHKEEPEFDIAKLGWERKYAMATQKRAKKAQARSKRKKAADPGAMMISSYKAPINDSIFADLSPFVVDLMISDHEKSDSEKEWGALIQDITNGEDWFFQTHGFSDPILGVKDQVVPELYSLKDGSPIDIISDEYVNDSQEYVEETVESSTDESSLESNEEDYPSIFMNHQKEPDVSEVDDDQDDITDDPIPERRPEPMNTIPKNVRTGFHTFTLDDVKVTAWPQRIQDLYWMVTKNLVEREKYMILSEFTSRFSDILRDWWTAIGVANRNFFLTSQDFATNLNILLEVFCRDTGQRREKLRRQLFEMNCISFDRDIIDIHFQKMERIYFELGGDSSLKQVFVSSLPRMLAGHAMTVIGDRFKSITIPHIGYIRQAIFQALDSICTKRSVLKQVVQNNTAFDKVCSRSDIVTKSDCSCSSRRARRKTVKRRSPGNYMKYDRCFIYNKPGHFAKNCPQSTRSVKTLQLFDDITDHTGIYLSRGDDLESVFSLEDEPMCETLSSIDVYEMAGDDTNIDDDSCHNMYQISNAKMVDFPREVDTAHIQLSIYSSKWDKVVQNFSTPSNKLIGLAVPGRGLIIRFDIYTQFKDRLMIRTKGITFRQQFKPYTSMSKLFQISGDEECIGNPTNTVFMFKKPRINSYEMAEYPQEVFNKYGGFILKPFGVHPEYPYYHVFILLADDFPQELL